MTNRPVSGNYIQGNPTTHPGAPVGKDRVPAWLAPNEFVVNAEATQMYGPQIEAMNNHGRAVQAQTSAGVQYFVEGGSVPDDVWVEPPATAPANPGPEVMTQVPEMQTPPAPTGDIFSGDNWSRYSDAVASVESGGFEDPYSIYGGHNDHYVGKYQLGSAAIKDASRFLGIDAPSREAVRQNPALQEKLFNAYTQANHESLMGRSESYRNMDAAGRQRMLGYAHNQGAGGASKFLRTGQEGRDAFGTSGLKYVNAIGAAQSDPLWTAQTATAGMTPEQIGQAYPVGTRLPEAGAPPPIDTAKWMNFSLGEPVPDQAGGIPAPAPVFVPTTAAPGGASPFLRPGQEGRDAFGTSGLKYPNAIGAQGFDMRLLQSTPTGMTPEQIGQMYSVGTPVPEDGAPPPAGMTDYMGFSLGEPAPDQAALHPAWHLRHLVGANSINATLPEDYTNRVSATQDEWDVLNQVGAKNIHAALPEDYDLAQTSFGREGMPREMMIPRLNEPLPAIPGVDAATNLATPGRLEVPELDTKLAHPEAYDNARMEYVASREEANYLSQQELDQVTLQLQTTPRDAPAYEILQERRTQLLQNLRRANPSFTGSSIPNPEALGTDILGNYNTAVDTEAEIVAQTQAVEDAAMRGDDAALAAAEAALIAARQQQVDTQTEAEEMSQIRRENAVEDQARQNSAIQLEVLDLDAAIAKATTPEGVAALTKARDAKIAQMDVPPMPPAGQTADGIPAIDKSVPPAPTPPAKADVETKIAEAEATVEPGDTVLDDTPAEAVEAAGAKAVAKDPSALKGAFSSLKNFFGDMFDIDELKRMAILYVGARLTGASSGASLAFAGKSYLSRLGAKEKAYNDAALSGDYTRESLADFKRSDDPADLRKITVPPVATGQITTRWTDAGEPVSLEKFTYPDGSARWLNANNQVVDPRLLKENEPKSAHDARRAIEADILPGATEFYETNGTRPDAKSGKPVNKVQVGPVMIVQQASWWAQLNGYNVEHLNKTGILNNAMMDMFNDKSPGKKNDITPYLEMNNMRYESSQGDDMLAIGTNEDGSVRAVSPSVIQVVNETAVDDLRKDPAWKHASKQQLLTQAYSSAWADYNDDSKVSADERKQWEKKSSDDTSGFIEYFKSLAE